MPCGIAYSVAKAKQLIETQFPDLVLLDMNLGQSTTDGIELGKLLLETYHIPFIYLTAYADAHTISMAKQTLPMAYLTKPYKEAELFASIEIALHNFTRFIQPVSFDLSRLNAITGANLTPKEFEVLQGLYQGLTNQQLSDSHFVSPNTIKTHIRHVYEKLGVNSRPELLVLMRRIFAPKGG
jgi:DNA-binding NarL/FixJ family response regulator